MAQAKISDSIPNEECLTVEDIAEELGISAQRARQVVEKAIKDRHVQNLTKTEGRRILYTPQMIEQLRKANEKGLLGKFRKKSVQQLSKNAVMVVHVPIYDPDIAKLLVAKYKDEAGILKYAKEQLEASVKSILQKKQELMAEYEKKLQSLLHSPDISM